MRLRGANVIDCVFKKKQIINAINKALSESFKRKIRLIKNPYGEGNSSKKILKILKETKINNKLLTKKYYNMKKNLEKYVVSIDGILEDAVKCIRSNKSRCVIIIDNRYKVMGVISEGDVLSEILSGRGLYNPIKNSMNINFKFLKILSREKALGIFRKYGVSLIPIVDENLILKDIFTINDFLLDEK